MSISQIVAPIIAGFLIDRGQLAGRALGVGRDLSLIGGVRKCCGGRSPHSPHPCLARATQPSKR
jgi:hypothetical protein